MSFLDGRGRRIDVRGSICMDGVLSAELWKSAVAL
jgi:hypothetical protein